MLLFLVLLGILFIVTAISRNQRKDRLKQASLSLIVISLLHAFLLDSMQHASQNSTSVLYLDVIEIKVEIIPILLHASLITAFLALLVYLFSDTDIDW